MNSIACAPEVKRLRSDFRDWDAVLALLREAFAYMEQRIDPPSSLHRLTVENMAAQARDGAVLAVMKNDRPVACLFCTARADALYLGKLAVASSHRGRGLARALLNAAATEAHARGLAALTLSHRIELTENHDAFLRMGFRKTGTENHPGYTRPTSILMRKDL